MKEVNAIAIYQPSDPLEKAIQDTYHEYEGGWLPAHVCQLAAKAFASLKMFDPTWIEEDHLYKRRCAYWFVPEFAMNKDVLVFLTMPVYLRDIIENNEINNVLHSPVVFVTPPMARYLYKEYSVKIYIKKDVLISDNKCQWFNIGGLLVTNSDVNLSKDSIMKVKHAADIDIPKILGKAASLVGSGIFQIDEHERFLVPGMKVRDKANITVGTIDRIEPGENGMIYMIFSTGNTSIGKQFFDLKFSLLE